MHANAIFDPPTREAITINLSQFHKETLRTLAFSAMRRMLNVRSMYRNNPNVNHEVQMADLGVIVEALEQALGSRAMGQVFNAVEAQSRPWENS